MALVRIPAGQLYVEERGDGSALLLIQGLGNSSWPARFLFDELAARRRVVAFDNRGTGRSFKEPLPQAIDDLADDAAALLETLAIDPAHVLGHSMGGYIAQTLALRRPELVRSLVLVGTGAGEPSHEAIPAETLDGWLTNAHLPLERYARATMHLSFAPGWSHEHADEFERLLTARIERPTPPECWRAQFDACWRFVETGLPVEEIRAPTLVVHGDADRVVPVSNGRAIARRVPGAELAVFANCGHYPQFEDPARFVSVVDRFLERVEQA